MVTTESRTDATTAVSSGAVGEFVAPATGRAAGARGFVPAVREGPSGPVTRAAVPPAASTADRIAATATEVPPRRGAPGRRGGEAGVGAGGSPGAGGAGTG